MADFRGRTAEEREAARLERERRRAGESGADAGPHGGAGAAQEAISPDGEARGPGTAPPDADDDLLSPYDTGELALPEPGPAEPAHDEAASGTRRVGWREARGARKRTAPRRPRKPPGEPRHHRFGAPHSRLGRAIAVVGLLFAAAVIWFLVELFQPFHGSGHGEVTLTIPAHASKSQIGDQLERAGVIQCTFPSCSLLFELRAGLSGSKLLPGTYHLRQDMSYGDVIKVLSTLPPPVPVTGVTITPGKTRREIDALLRKQGVKGSYVAASRHSHVLNPRNYGAPPGTNSLEGFLFPDTYQLRVPVNVDNLVNLQLARFKQEFAKVGMGYARSQHLTPYQVLTVASMVETEAQTAHDRPLVASVIYNRMRIGMLLQIDATVRYAVDNYTDPITKSQLHSPSPWNTYTHKGLPPTPISNPGLASIQAAAHPATTSYLFFVVKPCGNGSHAFASTYAQFQQQEQQYQAARTRAGGRSPANCQ